MKIILRKVTPYENFKGRKKNKSFKIRKMETYTIVFNGILSKKTVENRQFCVSN